MGVSAGSPVRAVWHSSEQKKCPSTLTAPQAFKLRPRQSPPGSTPADQCPRGKSPPQAVQKSFSLEVPLYRQAEAIWRDGSWSHLHMWSLRGVGQRTTRAVHFFCIFRPHRGYYLERLRDGCLCCSTLPTGVAVAWGMRRVCRCAGLPWFVFCC